MIMYFDFRTYFRMLRLAWHEESAESRRRLLFMLLAIVPVVSTFHAVCFFLDGLLFPGLRKVEVRTPVFIVGHARSGTTLFHRLMTKDGERFSYFMLYEMFLPSLLQKKVVRWLAACDRRLLGGRIEARVMAWDKKNFDRTREVHSTGLTAPEEDDFAGTFSCASGFWIVLAPYMGDLDFYYVDERPPRSRRRLMRFYRECVKRQLYLNGTDKIHLSKNPTFSGRVESLIEEFPDARIVVLMRNPLETIPSLLSLMRISWKVRGWDDARMRPSMRILADQSFHTYRHPLEVLARHPETRSAVVDYRDLVAEPKRIVEQVYAELGFPVSNELRATLLAEQSRAREHETTHAYSLEQFGLEGDAIHKSLADLFERFHWDETIGAPAAPKTTAAGGGQHGGSID